MADYQNFGGIGCIVEDKLFRHFSYGASGNAVPASAILVTVNPTPGAPGLNFFANWQVAGGQSLDSTIGFDVLTSAPVIQGAVLQLVGNAGGAAIVDVAEQIPGSLDIHTHDPNFNDITSFAAVSELFASYGISLSASQSLDSASISEVHVAFLEQPGCTDGGCPPPPGCTDGGCGPGGEIPEPGTWLLIGAGLVGAGWSRFRPWAPSRRVDR